MGKFNGKDATVWMRALKPHTYEQKPIDVGDVYLAHEEMVETIEIIGFAKRDTPPPKAVRKPAVETHEQLHTTELAGDAVRAAAAQPLPAQASQPVQPMTTATYPNQPRRRRE
jgi:uncharacterized protein (UPF0147 family)